MKIVISKPKKVFLFILSILAVIIISSILAYLTDKEVRQNEFTIGSIDIKLEETAWDALPDVDNSGVPDVAEAMGPGDCIAKDPKVVNQGKNDAIVYLRVEVPKAEVKVGNGEIENQELFTFSVHGDNWKLMPDLTIDDETSDTAIYTYYYKNGPEEYLKTGAVSQTLFDSVTLKNITDFNGLGLEQQIVIKAYAIQTGDELIVDENPWISKFEQEKVIIPETVRPTEALYTQIQPQNYGQDVDYTVTSNGVQINEWKIFCIEDDVVTIIAKDLIPNNAIPVDDTGNGGTNPGSGMIKGTGNESNPCIYRAYWNQSTNTRYSAINKLLGAYKSENPDIWKDFVRSDLTGKAIAMGGVLTTTFVNSWNNYPEQNQTIAMAGDENTVIGVKIGTSATTSDTIATNTVSEKNKSNTLYYPRTEVFQDGTAYGKGGGNGYTDGKCYGYWMASPSGRTSNCIMSVENNYRVYGAYYFYACYGRRPAVRLSADVKGKYENGKWSIK